MKFLLGARLYSFRGYGRKLLETPAAVVGVVSRILHCSVLEATEGPACQDWRSVPVTCICDVRAPQKRCDFLHLSENKENSALCVIIFADVFLCLKNSISCLMGTI